MRTAATRTGDSWTLAGRKNPVLHGDCADVFVVSRGASRGGTGLFLVDAGADGLTRTGYRTHDERRGAQLVVVVPPPNCSRSATDAMSVIVAAQVRAQAALCAEAVGAMQETLRLTTEYLSNASSSALPSPDSRR